MKPDQYTISINEVGKELAKERKKGMKQVLTDILVYKDGEFYWNEEMAYKYWKELIEDDTL